jgi:hypothetical protein
VIDVAGEEGLHSSGKELVPVRPKPQPMTCTVRVKSQTWSFWLSSLETMELMLSMIVGVGTVGTGGCGRLENYATRITEG